MCRQSVSYVSGVRVQASVRAEVDACMLGFLVTGLLNLLGSCVHDCQGYLGFLGCWVRWVARPQRSLGNKSEQFPYEIVDIMNIVWEGSLPGSKREIWGEEPMQQKLTVSLRTC